MVKYSFQLKKNLIMNNFIIVVCTLVQKHKETLCSHYFHQYPHDLHNKIINWDPYEIPSENDSTLNDTVSKTQNLSNLPILPDLSSSHDLSKMDRVSKSTFANDFQSSKSSRITRFPKKSSELISKNCTVSWQCGWGRQCVDSKCVWGCKNDLECKDGEVCELYKGKCMKNTFKELVWRNNYLYEKSGLENNAIYFGFPQQKHIHAWSLGIAICLWLNNV